MNRRKFWQYLCAVTFVFATLDFFFAGQPVAPSPAVAQTQQFQPQPLSPVGSDSDRSSGGGLTDEHSAKGNEARPESDHKTPDLGASDHRADDQKILDQRRNSYEVDKQNQLTEPAWTPVGSLGFAGALIGKILGFIIPIVITAFIFVFVMNWFMKRQMNGGGGPGGLGNRTKSPAIMVEPDKIAETFEDVAGCEEAKADLKDVITFLKDPSRVLKMGGKAPRGLLMVGPPGTGKTLLARVVAKEAGAKFFFVSGSNFVEVFVGVGAARVRDMFAEAKNHAPSILFIDEIDAVGRHRGAGVGNSNDEREQTLNQILVEMDGFEGRENVIVIAATNRPDVLDPALLRPGRFDLQVTTSMPDRKARIKVLQVHTKAMPRAPGLTLELIADRTPGFSPAQLAGVCQQAVIVALRRIEEAKTRGEELEDLVTLEDIDEGVDRVQGGNKAERVISEDQMKNTAYHELSHALVSELLGEPVHKITILARSRWLGYVQSGDGERVAYTDRQLLARITTALAGREGQEEFLNVIDTGASNDFEQAHKIAYDMVTRYGMSRLGPMSWVQNADHPFLGKQMAMGSGPDLSEKLKEEIEEAHEKILRECKAHARQLLVEHRDVIERVVPVLMKKETILRDEWLSLLNR